MNITSYAHFLEAVNSQPQPQRMLFVFAEAGLPPDAAEEQKMRFQSQQGGTLTPVMCVDKLPAEVAQFADLVNESRQTGQRWDIVFAAALSGHQGQAPDSAAAEQPLKKMINAIQQGAIENFLAFDQEGELVHVSGG